MPNQTKKLYRSNHDKIIGGVAGGLAEHLSVDSTIVRIIFILLALADGVGLLIYIVLWILVPAETGEKVEINREEKIKEFTKNVGEKVQELTKDFDVENKGFFSNKRNLLGLMVVTVGLFFLFYQLFPTHWLNWHIFWPMVLIFVGLYLIIKHNRK